MGVLCKPLHVVEVGELITPKLPLTNDVVRHFQYAKECADVGGGLVAGIAKLEIVEIAPYSLIAKRWVKVAMVGSSPPRILKLSPEEYMNKFFSVSS